MGSLLAVILLLAVVPAGSQAALVRTNSWGDLWFLPQLRPTAVDFGPDGQVFVAESGRSRVARINTLDEVDLTWSTGENDYPRDTTANPVDLATDGSGNVYAVNRLLGVVLKYSPDGMLIDTIDPDLPTGSRPHGVAFHHQTGSLLVLGDESVEVLDTDGTKLDSWGGFDTEPEYSLPLIEVDPAGTVMIAGVKLTGKSSATRSIYRYEIDGTLISKWERPASVDVGWYEIIKRINGYTGIAPRSGGGAWVTYEGAANLIRGLSPTGTENAGVGEYDYTPGRLSIDGDGHFWISRFASVGEYASDGTLIRKFEEADFPKYSADRGEGDFDRVGDLEVDTDGDVYAYDPAIARAQRFGPTGGFKMIIDGPEGIFGTHPTVKLVETPDQGMALLDRPSKTLRFFGGTDTETHRIDVEASAGYGIHDAVSDGEDGFFVLSGPPSTVTHVDADGQPMSSWPAEPTGATGSLLDGRPIYRSSTGSILTASMGKIQEYTPEGELLRDWAPPLDPCSSQAYFSDFALDSEDNMYFLGTLSGRDFVSKFSPAGELLWQDMTGYARTGGFSHLSIGPDGAIYLAGGGIERFEREPGPSDVIDVECEKPDPPVVRKLKVKSVSFARNRKVARVTLAVPGGGKLTVTGGPKVKRVSRYADSEGTVTIAVRPKAKFMKPSKERKLKLTAKFAFDQALHPRLRTSRSLILKRPGVR